MDLNFLRKDKHMWKQWIPLSETYLHTAGTVGFPVCCCSSKSGNNIFNRTKRRCYLKNASLLLKIRRLWRNVCFHSLSCTHLCNTFQTIHFNLLAPGISPEKCMKPKKNINNKHRDSRESINYSPTKIAFMFNNNKCNSTNIINEQNKVSLCIS